MKKLLVVSVLAFSVSALADGQVNDYKCGIEIGKAIIQLSETKAKEDIVLLADSIANYDIQSKAAAKEKNAKMKEILYTSLNSTQQSIMLAISSVRSVSAPHADAIEKACGLVAPE